MNKYKMAFFLLAIAYIIQTLVGCALIQSREKAQRGDLNLDGKIDITDLSIMADNWGK